MKPHFRLRCRLVRGRVQWAVFLGNYGRLTGWCYRCSRALVQARRHPLFLLRQPRGWGSL